MNNFVVVCLYQGATMNGEVRQSKSIKMKPSIVFKAHQKAKEEGKTLGRWIEEAIEQRLERERESYK